MTDTETPNTTDELVALAMTRVGAVGKDRQADPKMGGYSFRGIEDVVNAVHPILSDLGLTLKAETAGYCLEFREVKTNTGTKERRTCTLHVEFALVGPDGASHPLGSWWGEGDAYDDKASNKAYSAALKLCLLHTFLIPTVDALDTESSFDPNAGAEYTETTPDPDAAELAEVVANVKRLVAELPVDDRVEWAKGEAATEYRGAYSTGSLTLELAKATERSVAGAKALAKVGGPAEPSDVEEPF